MSLDDTSAALPSVPGWRCVWAMRNPQNMNPLGPLVVESLLWGPLNPQRCVVAPLFLFTDVHYNLEIFSSKLCHNDTRCVDSTCTSKQTLSHSV